MHNLWRREQRANLITLSRLIFLPLVVLAGVLDQPGWFVGLFAVQAALDGVDGLVARRLHIESDLGRRLDTVIDMAIWLPSLALFVWLVRDEFDAIFPTYLPLFVIPVLTSIFMYVTAYHYLHTVAAIHLYTAKLTGVLVLLLMLAMLLDRFYPLLGVLTACLAVLYHLEAMLIYFLKKDQTDENVMSIWQVLRQRS